MDLPLRSIWHQRYPCFSYNDRGPSLDAQTETRETLAVQERHRFLKISERTEENNSSSNGKNSYFEMVGHSPKLEEMKQEEVRLIYGDSGLDLSLPRINGLSASISEIYQSEHLEASTSKDNKLTDSYSSS